MKKTKRHYLFVLAIGLLFLAGICSICLSIGMEKTEYNADIVNNSENFLIKGSFLGVSLMECFYTELSETATEYVAVSDNVQNEEGYLIYDYWGEFREERNLPYADDETFEFIKGVYAEIDFRGEFKSVNSEIYDEYREIYQRLIQCEVPFRDKTTEKEVYMTELDGFRDKYDVNDYKYYFFDADEDDLPELGVRSDSGETYIFKYNPDEGEYRLWYSMGSFWYLLLGSRKVVWPWDGKYLSFYQLDQDGNEECETFFMVRDFNEEESLCVVMIPKYAEKEREVKVPEEMKVQGIHTRSTEEWYFRVTKEQYDELCQPYWDAYDSAEEEIKEVTYTYEDLFGFEFLQ